MRAITSSLKTNTAGVTLREYVWLNDLPVAVVDGVNTAAPVVYYVHTDHLGRPARMVAQNWAWVWDVIYSPFGGTAAIFDATARLDMRFPGQWFQMESGLAYNWHRHYDASLGRYVQPDPIGYAGGRSLYGYVGQNPLAYVDPFGLERKPGKTPPKLWPQLPEGLCGKKPKWNPEGYWEGGGRRLTWDDRSHGAGINRGNGAQGGHWDDEDSDNRWDEHGELLPGSEDAKSSMWNCGCSGSKLAPWVPLILLLPFPGNPIYGGL